MHAQCTPPGRKALAGGNWRSLSTASDQPKIPLPKGVVNLAPLTTIPDRLFGTYAKCPARVIDEANLAADAWRKSKEALGTKERKERKGGWAAPDKYALDGPGLLKTKVVDLDGEVDGLLG